MIRSPAAVIGDKALKAAKALVWPVPPFPMARAVPDQFALFTLEREARDPRFKYV
jgi:hypothetical protein